MDKQTEGQRIAKIVCFDLPPEFELGVAAEINAAIAQAVAAERERARGLRIALNVMVNRYGVIPLRFLKDRKMERFKHYTLADLHEAYEDAREELASREGKDAV